MDERPSAPLLRLLRDMAKQRSLNTAALAKAAAVDRSELKQILSGQLPLTVDVFVCLANALDLGIAELGTLTSMEPTEAPTPLAPISHTERAGLPSIDPLGNHADQVLRLGFALGCDMLLVLQTEALNESGVPKTTLEKFPELLPIRLDAAFFSHNDPRFLPQGLVIKLSFDAVYTCTLPWNAFQNITMIPLGSGPQDTDDSKSNGPHLRLVE